MRVIKNHILLSILFILPLGLSAQKEAMFTQYMHNEVTINPAYAGTHDALSATALYRKQWVGIDGAPETFSFNVHAPIETKRIGLGISYINDKIGVVSNNNLYGSFSYKIPLNHRGTKFLSFGLQAGFTQTQADLTSLDIRDHSDLYLHENSVNGLMPNFGAGVYYYTDKLYLGLSVPQLIKNSISASGMVGVGGQERHFFLTAGYVFDISPMTKFKPSAFINAVAGAPLQVALTANLIFYEKYWVGAAYRSFDAVSLLLMYQVNDQFRVGYAYDYSLTALTDHNSGSHEIVLNYRMTFKKDKILTPRYF